MSRMRNTYLAHLAVVMAAGQTMHMPGVTSGRRIASKRIPRPVPYLSNHPPKSMAAKRRQGKRKKGGQP